MRVRRRQLAEDEFVREFYDTYLPGSIPNDDFLNVDELREPHHDTHRLGTENPYDVVDGLPTDPDVFEEEFARALRESSAPEQLIRISFYLVGHSVKKDVYVSRDSEIHIADAAARVSNGDEETIETVARTLRDIGLPSVLDIAGARKIAAGVNIGLQTDTRKSKGGDYYEELLHDFLTGVEQDLQEDGYVVRLEREYTNPYKDKDEQSKRLDFALLSGTELVIAFEASCYTTSGSKPSETKRAYEDLSRWLAEEGQGFVWFIDGYGWKRMENLLREANRHIDDVYNYEMARAHLADDLRAFLEAEDAAETNNGDGSTSETGQRNIRDW